MKKILLSTLLASCLLTTNTFATQNTDAHTEKNVQAVNDLAIKNAKRDALATQEKLIVEAINSLKFTQEALLNLKNKDTEKATQNLEKALGKLEVILSAKNAPKLLPIDNMITVNEYIGTKAEVEATLKTVKKLLDDNKVQVARELLNTLQSEIDVTVVSLPLVTYPDALKLAAQYIHDNKIQKAQKVLEIALSTFDRTTEIIPLPLLKATDLIAMASELSAKGKKEEALTYLNYASDELDVAQALGYVSSSDHTYKALHEVIEKVEKEIKGKNKAEKLFDELKAKLKDFKDKVFSDK